MTLTNNDNIPDNFGNTPESLASQGGYHDIVELLKRASQNDDDMNLT